VFPPSFDTEIRFAPAKQTRNAIRRCILYGILAECFIYYLEQIGLLLVPGLVYLFLPVFGLLSLPILLAYERTILKLDADGIWQRTFVHWYFWSWDEIRSDQVEWDWERQTISNTNRCSKERKYLSYGVLSDEDTKIIRNLLYPMVRKPVPPVPVDKHQLQNMFDQILMTRDEITIQPISKSQKVILSWDQVSVIIWRRRRDLMGFVRMELITPARKKPITFSMHGQKNWGQRWQGTKAPELAEFFLQQALPGNVLIIGTEEPPISQEEYDIRQDDLIRRFKQFILEKRIVIIVCQVFLLLLMLDKWQNVAPWNWLWWEWLVFAVFGLILELIALASWIANRQGRAEFKKQLTELNEQWPNQTALRTPNTVSRT